MNAISPAQRALLISGFVAGNANPSFPRVRNERRVRMLPMWNEIDATERPERYKSGLGKKKKIKPFINHQSRYKKLTPNRRTK